MNDNELTELNQHGTVTRDEFGGYIFKFENKNLDNDVSNNFNMNFNYLGINIDLKVLEVLLRNRDITLATFDACVKDMAAF